MFKYNLNANYQPNGGKFLSGKDLYKQEIVVSKMILSLRQCEILISAVLVGLMITCRDSMTQWILEKSEDFSDVGSYRISESVRAYAYSILSSQASARSSIIVNTVSALTTQQAF